MGAGAHETFVRRARVTDIITLASKLSGVDVLVITGRCREKSIVRIRHAVCKVSREHGHSLPFIARLLGGRDHTTIMHACAQVEIHYPREPDYAAFVDELRKQALENGPFLESYKGPVKLQQAELPKPAPQPKPKNNFRHKASEPADGGHHFHAGIARGSKALADALRSAA